MHRTFPVLMLALGFIVGTSIAVAYSAGAINFDGDVIVDGTVTIQDGTQGDGKVFTSDGTGTGSWQTSTTGGSLSCENQVAIGLIIPAFVSDPSCFTVVANDKSFSGQFEPSLDFNCNTSIFAQVTGGNSPINHIWTLESFSTASSPSISSSNSISTNLVWTTNPFSELPATAVFKITSTDTFGNIVSDTMTLTCTIE